jgi:hypothetical protein
MRTSSNIRHWVSGLSLLAAVVMLILGLTVLSARLNDFGFAVYWLVCLGFTCVAALTALLDMKAIKQQAREAQRRLIGEILNEIEEERRKRSPS